MFYEDYHSFKTLLFLHEEPQRPLSQASHELMVLLHTPPVQSLQPEKLVTKRITPINNKKSKKSKEKSINIERFT